MARPKSTSGSKSTRTNPNNEQTGNGSAAGTSDVKAAGAVPSAPAEAVPGWLPTAAASAIPTLRKAPRRLLFKATEAFRNYCTGSRPGRSTPSLIPPRNGPGRASTGESHGM